MQTCNGQATQQWTLDTSNRLINAASALCLDIAAGSSTAGSPVIVKWVGGAVRRSERMPGLGMCACRGSCNLSVDNPCSLLGDWRCLHWPTTSYLHG